MYTLSRIPEADGSAFPDQDFSVVQVPSDKKSLKHITK